MAAEEEIDACGIKKENSDGTCEVRSCVDRGHALKLRIRSFHGERASCKAAFLFCFRSRSTRTIQLGESVELRCELQPAGVAGLAIDSTVICELINPLP